MPGSLAAGITCAAPSEALMPNCMFDWPEQTQTSPTSTSSTSTRFLAPFTISLYGPPAACVGNTVDHLPSARDLVVAVAPLSSTVISSPGLAQPHTGSR